MILDALLSFVAIGAPLSFANQGAGDVASTNVIDMEGAGPGSQPNIIGRATVFTTDLGIGGQRPQLQVNVGTAFATADAATLQVKFQSAPDTAVTYLPGAYTTLVETPAIAAASLTAGQILARFDFPPAFPASLSARYLRLLFTVAVGTFTAGTISSAVVTMVRDDQANKYQASNYLVA